MAATITKEDKNTCYREFTCDTLSDLQTIVDVADFGNVAYIISEQRVFIFNSEGSWEEM